MSAPQRKLELRDYAWVRASRRRQTAQQDIPSEEPHPIEIVSLLIAGHRVCSIAKRLSLSEGTIRNHLSSVFGKLGVGTQQELIDLLRPTAADRRGQEDRRVQGDRRVSSARRAGSDVRLNPLDR